MFIRRFTCIDATDARLTTGLNDELFLFYPDHYVQSPDIHSMEYLAGIFKEHNQHSKISV